MKSKTSIQSIVRGSLALAIASTFGLSARIQTEVAAQVPVVAPAPAATQASTVGMPLTIDVTGVGGDVTVTTGGTINNSSPTDISATAGTAGSPNKTFTMKGPIKIKLSGTGNAKITASAPGTIVSSGATTTVAGTGVAVGIEITAPDKQIDLVPKEGGLFPLFYLTVGAVTLNPYRIDANGTGGYKIDTSSSETAVLVQVDYADRWAWQASNQMTKAEWPWWKFLTLETYDFQFRAGYTFGNDQTNASTIMGSGNLDIDFTVAKQIYRVATETSARSLDLGVVVSTVTDRQFSDSHTSVTLGGSYVTSFRNPFANQNTNRVYLFFGGGLANYELPRFTGTGTDIAANGLGLPDFQRVWGGMMNTEVRYQLGQESFISAGARVFPSRRIAPWELWVGYSASFDQIRGVIGKLYQ